MTDPTDKPAADASSAAADSAAPALPPLSGGGGGGGETAPLGGMPVIGPPPSFGKQMAQLVIIPAVIVLVCIGLAALFGKLAGGDQDVDAFLLKLQQSGGAGRLYGIQDPRYKDRWLAAYNVATIIPKITDPVQKQKVSDALVDILKKDVEPDEDMLKMYLYVALSQLGQRGGLEPILAGLSDPKPQARLGALQAIWHWPDAAAARQSLPAVRLALNDTDPVIVSWAALDLGKLAQPGDETTIDALHKAMDRSDSEFREAVWNSAGALTGLGDRRGRDLVIHLLLDRQALAGISEGVSGQDAQTKMTPATQDNLIVNTLEAVQSVTDPELLHKIKQLHDNDPSIAVRMEAEKLLLTHPNPDESKK